MSKKIDYQQFNEPQKAVKIVIDPFPRDSIVLSLDKLSLV